MRRDAPSGCEANRRESPLHVRTVVSARSCVGEALSWPLARTRSWTRPFVETPVLSGSRPVARCTQMITPDKVVAVLTQV